MSARFAFVIPVYNEEPRIAVLLEELLPFVRSRPGSLVVVSDNASSDGTVAQVRARMNPDNAHCLHLIEAPAKGQGVAYERGMAHIQSLGVSADTWVVLSAADLPFYFSDALGVETWGEGYDLVIGSKAHPRSRIARGPLRGILSRIFLWIRILLLNMRSRDPQGCLFIRARHLGLRTRCEARNYFFATQLVYEIEREGLKVLEVPVILRPDDRPSKVRVVRDSLEILRQTWAFSRRRGRIRSRTATAWAPGEPQGPDWRS
ncbi:MAG: glycosyltransferase [Bdellovibrionaceae bacterium]|nr:glycosyltransferase [Pseudobdellovibrionaceae bacterium]